MASKVITLVKYINHHDKLTAQEKVVGVTMALAFTWRKGVCRIRREKLVERTGMSLRAVGRALTGLVDKKIFKRKRTGRSTIYTLGSSVRGSDIVDGPNMAHQKGHKRHIEKMTLEEQYADKQLKNQQR